MKGVYLLIFIFLSSICRGQEVNELTELADPIKESSGLIYLNQKIISINDSGGNPALYEIDSVNGDIVRTVTVSNASNVDWEEICMDDDFIYICDFGNNNGTRTDLRIYRLPISDYLNSSSNLVSVDTIEFSYSDQTDFSSATYSTNFDAEASVVIGDSIYIFTKNWGDNLSNIYSIPKTPGNYLANKIASIDPQGLITGASYDAQSESIILTGYSLPNFFVVELSNVSPTATSFDQLMRYNLSIPSGYSMQVEGVALITASNYYLTSEKSVLGSSGLFTLSMNGTSNLASLESEALSVFPNPFSNSLFVDLGKSFVGVDIVVSNALGKIVYQGFKNSLQYIEVDFNEGSGVYFLQITRDSITSVKRIIKN